MSDFMESAKNFMNSAVSRTSWEAQKQLRVRSKQGELDKLTDAQLSRLCASIMELDQDARTREVQLQEVKNETYPADQFAPAPTTNYTPPTSPASQPGQPYQPYQPAQPVNTPGTQNVQNVQNPSNAQQMHPCPNCGQPVRANALYCRNCGAKLR